jgi:hypothetical protein
MKSLDKDSLMWGRTHDRRRTKANILRRRLEPYGPSTHGITPRRYQSGEIDRAGRISKCGDTLARTLIRPGPGRGGGVARRGEGAG